ncbi:MAG: hypothetical protein NDI61_13640, partial [Bdellovibrionaceae bacterium]|nr:hypothetical protein [Pseudobdellovibrionaceae bacterium]
YALSPEAAKVSNIAYLAAELERVGQAATSVEVWRLVEQRQSRPAARLESQVHLAQLEMNLGRRADALKDFEAAIGLWSTMDGCQEANCAELKSRMRKFIVEWNRVEKKDPPAELFATYEAYLKTFPQEFDMRLWAAQVATQLKAYDRSMSLYDEAIRGLAAAIQPGRANGSALAEGKAMLEAATLGAVETAELSQKPEHLDRGYGLYLEHSPERKKVVEVRYQKAHLLYEKGDYNAAAVALRDVAMSNEAGSPEVKVQAAELALDSLVLVKNDTLIETWAREFADRLPGKRDEFLKLARTSVFNQVATGTDKSTDKSTGTAQEDLAQAWVVLARFPVSEATPAEQATYWKNRLVLAEKMGKFADAREAAEALYQAPQASDADRQYALSRKAWLAELVLDFDGALTATEKMPAAAFDKQDQRWLKLALYADLAAKDSKPFLEKYLKDSSDAESRRVIAARLVRESGSPLKELEKQKSVLLGDAELYARLVLEVFAQTQNFDLLRQAVKQAGVEKSVSGRVIGRELVLNEFQTIQGKLSASQLNAETQKKLASSIKSRMSLLEQLEKLATRAVQLQDWTAQLVTLDRLARESERFYQEILALPVPAGLSGEDEQQYLALLSQQASPHQVRAQDVGRKVAEFWANETAIPQLKASLAAEHGPLRKVLAQELALVQATAPDAKKSDLQSLLALSETRTEASPDRPTRELLEAARRSVRENPMHRQAVSRLLELERQAGREVMATYLETRLSTLGEVKQ